MSKQGADNEQAVSAIGSKASERMTKVMDTKLVQARCRPDAHPKLLKTDQVACPALAWENVGIAFTSFSELKSVTAAAPMWTTFAPVLLSGRRRHLLG